MSAELQRLVLLSLFDKWLAGTDVYPFFVQRTDMSADHRSSIIFRWKPTRWLISPSLGYHQQQRFLLRVWHINNNLPVQRSVDIFALGCLFYYILTRGGHPYGHRFEREINIRHGVKDLSLVYSNEEAHDLITHMLHRQPSDRFDIKTDMSSSLSMMQTAIEYDSISDGNLLMPTPAVSAVGDTKRACWTTFATQLS